MARAPSRDSSTQAAVTSGTYRNARIDRGPPVAATTAVTSVASSTQRSRAAKRGRDDGPNTRSVPEETTTTANTLPRRPALAVGMATAGAQGPTPTSSVATTTRAHENARRSACGSVASGFTT
jgi:hypothetical protein